MKEKKVIDYTRTYRRIEADKKKCILYIVILILLGFLLMWTQIDDLTRWILFYKRIPKENKCQSLYVHSRRKMSTRANSIDFGKATFDDNI